MCNVITRIASSILSRTLDLRGRIALRRNKEDMAYQNWFGATTRDGVPRWQVLIVYLAMCLVTFAILGLIPQSVSSVLLFSESTTHRLISCVMMMGSTAVAVTIVATAVFRIRKRVLAFSIVASRYAFLISAANALWLAITMDLYHNVEVGQLGYVVWPANRAGLFLTMAQSVLSLVLSCICITWGNERSRQISRAVVRIISGFVILPAIAFGGLMLSTKLYWPALLLLAWSICFMLLGIILGAILVSSRSSPHYMEAVDPGKHIDNAIMTLEVINILLATCLVMVWIGGVLSDSGSSGCIENLKFECSPLMTGFYGLCLIIAIEESLASISSLLATLNQSRGCDGTNGEDANHATIEGPPTYEELFNNPGPGSDLPNEDHRITGCCSEVAGASGAVERQESLPPQYKDVVYTISSDTLSLIS